MLADAAHKLGFWVIVLDPMPQSPAAQVADEQIVGDFKDEASIRSLAQKCDFMTFEIELAGERALQELADFGVKINPSPATLSLIKDKLSQKEFLKKWDVPTADFAAVETRDDIARLAKDFGYPLILKARFDGYDGRGNAVIENEAGIDAAIQKLSGRLLYAERFVPFDKELSVVAARGMDGSTAVYPVAQTIHKNNICHEVLAPAPVPADVRLLAEELARRAIGHFDGAGVFGIEMFLVPAENGEFRVLINEIAPRVHNSGHHTIEACATSQFENHIRAVTGMPLGENSLTVPAAVMVNILGERAGQAEPKGIKEALSIPGVSVHIYGKAETRPERKMGHLTAVGATLDEAREKAERARSMISI